MRFLHCSDIHLGRRPVGGVGEYSNKRFEDYFSAFGQIVDRAISEKVDALFIAGDLFDRRELSPEVLRKTEKFLQRLRDQDIEVVAIEGNHDNITPGKEDESWLVYLEKRALLKRPYYVISRNELTDELEYHFTSVDVLGVNIFGLGYPGGMVSDVIDAFNQFLENNDLTNIIALIHTAPAGGDFLPGVIPHSDIAVLKKRVEYLACGHFHSYSVWPLEKPFLFIPGSSEYWDLAEKQGTKGMILFDTSTKKHQFIETEPRRKVHCSVSTEYDDSIYMLLEKKLKKLSIADNEDILIVEIGDKSGNAIDILKLEKIVYELVSPLKLEIMIRRDQKSCGTDKRRKAGESIESVERRIIRNWELFDTYEAETVSTINDLKEKMQSGDREQFNHCFDAFLDHIIERGDEA